MKLIFFTLIMITWTLATHACRCNKTTFTQEIEHADRIFVGTVIKNPSADSLYSYYLFSVSQTFKGDKVDTVLIRTDNTSCGARFQIGMAYVVYSKNKATSRCNGNSLADKTADLAKLKYVFQSGFSNEIGKTTNSELTPNEAEYFNYELWFQREEFDFHQKKVAFILNSSLIDKQKYFENWDGRDVINHLIVLTETEKNKVGYDAIVVSWRKQGVSKNFRKRLIKKLA